MLNLNQKRRDIWSNIVRSSLKILYFTNVKLEILSSSHSNNDLTSHIIICKCDENPTRVIKENRKLVKEVKLQDGTRRALLCCGNVIEL